MNDLNLTLPESSTLEYKRELPSDFLEDIIAFANSNGGKIIYGVDEENGIPTEVVGVEDADVLIQKIESSLRDRLEPKLTGYSIKTYTHKETGKTLLVIEIQNNFNKPYAIRDRKSYTVFGRNNIGKSPLDFMQIRQMANQSDYAIQTLRDFRSLRLDQILQENTSIVTTGKSKLILHLLPVASVHGFNFDVTKLKDVKFDPFAAYENYPIFNFDGCVYIGESDVGINQSYTQIFRNGFMECVDSYYLNRHDLFIPIQILETKLINFIKEALNLLKDDIAVFPPMYLCCALLNVKGKKIPNKNDHREVMFPSKLINQEHLVFSEFLIDFFQDENIELLLKENIFDQLWQASGHQGSMNFKDGKFIG